MAFFDWELAISIGDVFFRHGVDEVKAKAMIDDIAFDKYPKRRADQHREAFMRRAEHHYNRRKELEPENFGKWRR